MYDILYYIGLKPVKLNLDENYRCQRRKGFPYLQLFIHKRPVNLLCTGWTFNISNQGISWFQAWIQISTRQIRKIRKANGVSQSEESSFEEI